MKTKTQKDRQKNARPTQPHKDKKREEKKNPKFKPNKELDDYD